MIRPSMRPAAALLAALAGAAQAQNVQLQGTIDVAAGRFQPAGAARTWRADSGGMSPSFLALRGDDDLGGGLRARFALEHDLRLDTGQAGRFADDAFWSREASVGLSGAFGTTLLGRNPTPLYRAAVRFNAFGDSPLFSPTLRQLFAPTLSPFLGDTRWNNSMSFVSPDFDGIAYAVAANLGEAVPGARSKNLGAALLYERGPLAATAAWQKVRNGLGISEPSPAFAAPAGFHHQEVWHLGVAYAVDVARLFGQYSHVRTEAQPGTTTKAWSVSAAVPLGAGRVLAQYGNAIASLAGAEPRHRMIALGYDHLLSARTDLYAVFVNDRVSGRATGRTFAGGMRMRF